MNKPLSRSFDDPNETVRQATTFEGVRKHYIRLGLCSRCAAQAAFGHQLGFSRSKSPCPVCQPIVDQFPTAKPNRWRSNSPRRGAMFSDSIHPAAGDRRLL